MAIPLSGINGRDVWKKEKTIQKPLQELKGKLFNFNDAGALISSGSRYGNISSQYPYNTGSLWLGTGFRTGMLLFNLVPPYRYF